MLRIEGAWLSDKDLQRVLDVLGHSETRIVGGAVRDSLSGLLIDAIDIDIDLATVHLPDEVTRRGLSCGWKVFPTGIDYGTVTLKTLERSYQVTTLRCDVSSDGRHPCVTYGTDWETDCLRRDFTMNSLYADYAGVVYDYLGGLDDLNSGIIRFVGDSEIRIREDYLRILRFFRFFAYYGEGRPDAAGLRACARLKDNITSLSSERIWYELERLLSSPNPHRALLWMRQSGVLSVILPESDKWGIDDIPKLISTEGRYSWVPDSVLRLMCIIPPSADIIESISSRLRLSNNQRDRLLDWATSEDIDSSISRRDLHKLLYRHSSRGIIDRLHLAISRSSDSDRSRLVRRLNWCLSWSRPDIPVRGRDLIKRGIPSGPDISRLLNQAESHWIDSDFSLTKSELLDLILPPS